MPPAKAEINCHPRHNMAYRAGYSKLLMKINIPTKITIARIVLMVVMLIGLFVAYCFGLGGWVDTRLGDHGPYVVGLIAAVVFIIASFTDYLDGHLARKWNQVTNLGKFLDPIADKMLVNSLLVFAAVPMAFMPGAMTIPWFCVVLMIVRDLIVDTMRFMAAKKNIVVPANIFGKMKTVFQMIAIPVILLNGWPFSYFDELWHPLLRIGSFLIYAATIMSLISGAIYVKANWSVLKED